MQPELRSRLRFDPVTVRAAARLFRLQAAGLLTERELDCCLLELSAMSGHRDPAACRALYRGARRLASLSASGPGAVRARPPRRRTASRWTAADADRWHLEGPGFGIVEGQPRSVE